MTSYSERLMKPPESSLGFLSLVKEFTCRVLLRDGFIYFPCKRFIHFLLVSFDISHTMSSFFSHQTTSKKKEGGGSVTRSVRVDVYLYNLIDLSYLPPQPKVYSSLPGWMSGSY